MHALGPPSEVHHRTAMHQPVTDAYLVFERLRALPESTPLYGRVTTENIAGQYEYHHTERFEEWLQSACSCTESNNFFHQWLQESRPESQHNKDGSKIIEETSALGPDPSNSTPLENINRKVGMQAEVATGRVNPVLRSLSNGHLKVNKKRRAVSVILLTTLSSQRHRNEYLLLY